MRLSLAAALSVLLAVPVFAQGLAAQEQGGQALFPGFDPGGRTRSWLKDAGPNWQVAWSHARGTPESLFGGNRPIVPAKAAGDDAQLVAAARGVVDELAPALGFSSATLELARVKRLDHLAAAGTSPKIVVEFRQVTGGVPTWDGSVNLLFSTDGRLLSLENRALPHVAQLALVPENAEGAALETALAAFTADTGKRAVAWSDVEYVVYPALVMQGKDAVRGAPAFTFKLDAGRDPGGTTPVVRTYVIAATGSLRVLASWSNVHSADLTGTVNGWNQVGLQPDGVEAEALHGLGDVRLTGAGVSTSYTGATGAFSIPGAVSPVTLTAALEGQFSRVLNDSGSETSVAVSVTPGVPATLTLNGSQTEHATAELNAHHWATAQRAWLKGLDAGENALDFQRTSFVNIGLNCNAYYDGGSTNYYVAGGGCPNTAFSTVVLHENGHWLNELFDSNPDGGFHEGGADCWAMYQANNPIIGDQFHGPGTYIRSGLNNTPFCGDASPGCYGEGHTDGEPLMGAVWKVRANLQTALGGPAGGNVADHLLLAWFQAYNDGQIKSAIETHWLTLDDDNGNINDGTPHYAPIDAGFKAQGFPGFTPPLYTITHNPIVIVNSELAVPIVAEVTPLTVAPATSVTLNWSADGVNWTPVAMTPFGGDLWQGFVPPQASPAVVRYWLQATGTTGSNKLPAGGAASPLVYDVGTLSTHISYDFEPVSDESWTHVQVQEQDDWFHDVPQGKAGDPPAAYSGARCWGNDLGLVIGSTVWNGSYRPDVNNYLQSPTFNFSGKTNLRLRFRRWLGVEDGFFDQARLQVNNQTIWTNPSSGVGGVHLIDQDWTFQDYDIGALANNNAAVNFRFRLETDGGLEFGGWNIDDFRVVSLGPVSPTAFIAYGTGTPGFGAVAPTLAGSGQGTPGGAITISVTNGRPNAVGSLFTGFAAASIPFKGGTFLVAPPAAQILLNLGPAGSTSVPGVIPADPGLYGLTAHMQYWCNDVAAVKGKAGSNGLKFTIN